MTYLPDDAIELGVLRQGDIIDQVHILGALNLNAISYMTNGDRSTLWCVQNEPKFGPAAVLSHSCEIDPTNDVKLTSIVLAPLRDINTATDPRKIQELVESNIIGEDTQFSYLKYFFLEPHEALPFERGVVIDFSKCFSVRNKSYAQLVQQKKLQLVEAVADQMALKLSLYFYRVQRTA